MVAQYPPMVWNSWDCYGTLVKYLKNHGSAVWFVEEA